MASQEEDNKLECISNVNKEQERYFLNVYKKHECILNNKNDSFEHKVESLIDVWKSIAELNLTQFDIRHVIQIMDWAKLHALNIVLTAEWNAFKETHQVQLLEEIEKAQTELLKLNSGFVTRCKKLADVVKNPWEDPVLMTLMKTKDAEIGAEVIEFFCVETAYVISVRLKKLCESQCEDLALNLVTAFMNCNKLSKTQNFSLNATETQMWFIFDIYIALLYKFQEKHKIVLLLKELTFQEGLQLVKRFAKKRVKISKIWKNCHKVAVLATQMYISQAVVKYTDDLKSILENYIELYLSLCNTEHLLQDFTTSLRRISNLADAAGLYIFCDVIQKKAGVTLKPFIIEMYIRALTTDMNELERQKDAKEQDKVEATTSRLAQAFCNLADFLDEHVKVARECVLTAFSLEPTRERMKSIESLARRSGYQVLDTGQEWKCKLHPPVLPSDELAWICPECGDWMCKPQLNIPLKMNMALNEALQNSVLGISEPLCDDLVVCLSNPRYQILSWFLPWDDLHRLCIMYLQDPQTTKNFVTELKFVDIDYSIFKGIKREPLDELAGIERGYEQYLDHDFVSDEETSSVSGDSMSQDSRPYSLGSDGAGEGPCLPLLSSPQKSDPKTLKSLRMFRPNLKRVRPKESLGSIPEKLHKTESGPLNLNHTQTVPTAFKNPSKRAIIKPSLSTYLNRVPSNVLPGSTPNHDPHSKNVKAATLPPLGGQVAKVMKSIQVLLQPLRTSQLPKNQTNQALKPHNQSKGTITEMTKKELMLKLLSKPSLSGFKENNNHKVENGSKPQDLTIPKIFVRDPIKLNTKIFPVHSTEVSTTQQDSQQAPNVKVIQIKSTHSSDNLVSTTNTQQIHLQLTCSPKQTQANLIPPLCPPLNHSQVEKPSTLDQRQEITVTNKNLNISCNNDTCPKRDNTQKVDKATAASQTPDWASYSSIDTETTLVSSQKADHQLITQKPETDQLGSLILTSPKREKLCSNTEHVPSLNWEKNQIKPDKKSTNLPVQAQPSMSPVLETIQTPQDDSQPHQSLILMTALSHPSSKAVQTNTETLQSNPPQSVSHLQETRPTQCLTRDSNMPLVTAPLEVNPSTSLRSDNPHAAPVMTNQESLILHSSKQWQDQIETRVLEKETPNSPSAGEVQPSSNLREKPKEISQISQQVQLSSLQPGLEMNETLLPGPNKVTSSSTNTNSSSESLLSMEYNAACQQIEQEASCNMKNQVSSSVMDSPNKFENNVNSDNNECILDKLDIKCNKINVSEGNVQTEKANGISKVENPGVIHKKMRNCLGVIDDGIFSDLTDSKSEDLFFQNNNDYSSFVRNVNMTENYSDDDLPKSFNLTENIRTYTNKSKRKLPIDNKDCVKMQTGVDTLDVCKNVHNSISIQMIHSNVQKPETKCKELRVILYRLPSIKIENGKHVGIRKKCDRGKTPPSVRRRRSMDKSENKINKAPNRVQNHKISPLQDINPRVLSKENSNSHCDDLIKPKMVDEDFISPRVLLERIHVDKQKFARSVLANVPGLNDYQMIRPTNVNHIVNVVQVSGNRPSQNVPIQSTQTSTQVSPHIQRIGQPRVVEQKPENSNSLSSTTTLTTTTTTAKTTTSQPSTLINILSQQILCPSMTQSNIVRRPAPLANIFSQQIIRPALPQKTVANVSVTTAESNQVKPAVATEQSANNQVNNVPKNANAGIKLVSPTTTAPQGGTILQFICKSTLPKFQQAFGKTVYQNSTDTSNPLTTTVEASSVITDIKREVTNGVPVNVQPIQGSVIYSRQVPVGQTISLIPPGGTTRQVFRIATSNPEQLSLVKDTVIHSKMSALLAAALQARPKNCDAGQIYSEEKLTLARPTLVQSARIVKPVQLQIPPNVRATPHTNLSSTTLEQLREFDMVYKQVKERSSSTLPTEPGNGSQESQEVTPQRISVTYVNQLQKYAQLSPVVVVSSYNSLQPVASPALSVASQGSSSPCITPATTPTLSKIITKTSKGKIIKTTPNNTPNNTPINTPPKSSPTPKPQQKPQEDEHTTQRIFDILAEYAEQLRNSPDLNNKPAPRRRSNPPTNPSQNSKRKKSSSGGKKTNQSGNSVELDGDDITVGSEDSSGGGLVQLSVTDDEQSQAATINTPESTENSNPSNSRQLILTEGGACGNQSRNLIIANSSVGEALKMPTTAVIVPGSYIMPVSMVKGGQQIAVMSGGSKILATVPARSGQNMLLFQGFMNQNRKGSISAVKYSTLQPISGISSQSLAGVTAQPPVILPSSSVAAAMALGQPLTLKKLNDNRDSNELLLTISQPKENSKNSNNLQQPDSSTSVSNKSNDIKTRQNRSRQSGNSNEKIFQTYQRSVITNSVATSVIATTSTTCGKEQSRNIINMNLTTDSIKAEAKPNERMKSVLVTACSSNGPMLSHTTPRYRKSAEANKTNSINLPNKEFLHNGEKANNKEPKTLRTAAAYYVNKVKKNSADDQKIDSEMQKRAAIERELRLQKSLSEECEDLGVDEPSTSDLFPEADLLFDSNHSPSFDQDVIKRCPQSTELKGEIKVEMNLFSDDETSSSIHTDLFPYVEYQAVETALNYQARQLMNGNTTSNESGSSGGEDSTLLAKCPMMSEVTLNSPISPELYPESTLNKYKFKYSNRKKGERMKQGDLRGEVVSSSEDTVESTESNRINCENDNYKLVHLAITKTDLKEEGVVKCELHCGEDLDSQSGRGARRSVRKLCSCCNGSRGGNLLKKRPHSSRPHTPAAPHKKAFVNKRR